MRVFKKLLCVGFIVAALVVSFSLSAFAFEPLDNPSFSGVSSDGVYYFDVDPPISDMSYRFGFICNYPNEPNPVYCEIGLNLPTSLGIGDISVRPCYFREGSTYSFGIVITSLKSSNTSYVSGAYTRRFFRQNGTSFGDGFSTVEYKVGYDWCGGLFILPNANFDCNYQPVDKLIYANETYFNLGSPLESNVPFGKTSIWGYSIPFVSSGGRDYYFMNGVTNVQTSGTDTDKLGVISGSGSAALERDSNGNITNITNNYEFDLGLNDSPVPDRWGDEFPDPEGDLLEQLPGIDPSDIDSINDNLSSDSLNSSAVQWWYARFSDVTSNTKYRVVMLSLLSLSVIAFTLNKRGVL